MRVIGFDPGTATTGYGVVEGRASRLRHLAHGVITTPANTGLGGRLKTIFEEASASSKRLSPTPCPWNACFSSRT